MIDRGPMGHLCRTRVVVATRDPDFRASAAAALIEGGCLVDIADRSSRVPELIGQARPNVVVVDAAWSPRAIGHVLAVLAATARPIALVVVVEDEVPAWVDQLQPVHKRDVPDVLAAEVERLHAELSAHGSALAALS